MATQEPAFSTAASATTTVKRHLRKNNIATKTVRSSRTADEQFLTCIFMPANTSDATYAKAAVVLTEAGFRVNLHVSTNWIAASATAR